MQLNARSLHNDAIMPSKSLHLVSQMLVCTTAVVCTIHIPDVFLLMTKFFKVDGENEKNVIVNSNNGN